MIPLTDTSIWIYVGAGKIATPINHTARDLPIQLVGTQMCKYKKKIPNFRWGKKHFQEQLLHFGKSIVC